MPPDPADYASQQSSSPSVSIEISDQTRKSLHTFRRVALVTTLLCYLLVFIGGLVRVSGAGLGCPDWPQCYGRWIPPLSISDLPAEVDPAHFNIVLAWIEYLNRLAGVTVGLFIAATAFLAFRLRTFPRIFYPALISLPLVALLGWQGKDVVASSLLPLVVTIHLLVAVLLVALLTYATQEAWYEESAQPGEWRRYPDKAKLWIGILAAGTISQILIGTMVRGELDTLATQFPMLTPLDRYGMLSFWRDLHFWSGLLVVLSSLFAVAMLRRLLQSPSLFVRVPMILITACVMMATLLGVTMSVIGPQPLLQLYHLWGAVILVGSLVVLYSALARENDAAPAMHTRMFRLTALRLGFAVIGMGIMASVVISSAERSRSLLPVISILPSFRGLDQNGSIVTDTILDSRITLVENIFTRCRGVCPPMAIEMKKLIEEINYADGIQVLSFTVDPEHDHPPVMHAYLDSIGARLGLVRWTFVNLGLDSIRDYCRQGLFVSDDLPGMHSPQFLLIDEKRQLRGYYHHADPVQMKQLRVDLAALSSNRKISNEH